MIPEVGEVVQVATLSGVKSATLVAMLPDSGGAKIRWKHNGQISVVMVSRIVGYSGATRESRPTRPAPSARARAPMEGTKTDPAVQLLPWDRKLAQLRPVPKPPKPSRSRDYLAFVRDHACSSCRAPGPSDPHHYGGRGMGQKTDDHRTVALCRTCHDHFHDHARLPGMDSATTKVLLLQRQVDLLVEWARKLESED